MSKYYLGIELGSTRIKSVLIDSETNVVAQGAYEWENELVDGLWSYSLENVEKGLQASFANLAEAYRDRFGEDLTGNFIQSVNCHCGLLPFIFVYLLKIRERAGWR